MKMLIIGASGLLGNKFFDYFGKKYSVSGTYFTADARARFHKNIFFLDVTDIPLLERTVLDLYPDIVIYAASLSGPDRCEQNPKRAKQIHTTGAIRVASISAALNKRFIYISTDYVFGESTQSELTEDQPPNPINIYGKTKLEAEEFILKHCPNSLIIRTSLIYGFCTFGEKRGLVNHVLEEVKDSNTVYLDTKIKRYPTLSDDICVMVDKLIDANESGIFHASGPEPTTKFKLAQITVDTFGLGQESLTALDEDNMPLIAKRPKEIKLSTKKIEQLGIQFVGPTKGINILRKQRGCLFRMIYSVRPDMLVAGQNASEFRIKAGQILAKESPIPDDVDHIIPIPESGIYPATGYAAESKIPIYFGLIRDYFTEKTLYTESQSRRSENLTKKLVPISPLIKGKSVILIDEAVISGSTLKVVVQKLKEAGAREIHIRIPSPIMLTSCNGRILPDMSLLSSRCKKKDLDRELAEILEVNSFYSLSLSSFLEISSNKKQVCFSCFQPKK